jgi:hypothetical protein
MSLILQFLNKRITLRGALMIPKGVPFAEKQKSNQMLILIQKQIEIGERNSDINMKMNFE